MTYGITFIDETLNRNITFDNVKEIEFDVRGNAIIKCGEKPGEDRFITRMIPEEFTKIVIERE